MMRSMSRRAADENAIASNAVDAYLVTKRKQSHAFDTDKGPKG
jgi:hypothetical protein